VSILTPIKMSITLMFITVYSFSRYRYEGFKLFSMQKTTAQSVVFLIILWLGMRDSPGVVRGQSSSFAGTRSQTATGSFRPITDRDGMCKYTNLSHEKSRNKILLFSWLGMRDSNPRSRDQNPVPYHLANPQYCGV
jgi:hypothetical protein